MAKAAGGNMSECRLLEENGRRHFMTRRFDRLADGGKLHLQSLCALAHYDFNHAGAYAYEQSLLAIRELNLPMEALEEQFRRMTFNIIARNQDDHVKNLAFLMDRAGRWSLAPAFDVTYSYNPTGRWTASHQMTMNGRRNGFALADFRACAKSALMKRGRAPGNQRHLQAAPPGVRRVWLISVGSRRSALSLSLYGSDSNLPTASRISSNRGGQNVTRRSWAFARSRSSITGSTPAPQPVA